MWSHLPLFREFLLAKSIHFKFRSMQSWILREGERFPHVDFTTGLDWSYGSDFYVICASYISTLLKILLMWMHRTFVRKKYSLSINSVAMYEALHSQISLLNQAAFRWPICVTILEMSNMYMGNFLPSCEFLLEWWCMSSGTEQSGSWAFTRAVNCRIDSGPEKALSVAESDKSLCSSQL